MQKLYHNHPVGEVPFWVYGEVEYTVSDLELYEYGLLIYGHETCSTSEYP